MYSKGHFTNSCRGVCIEKNYLCILGNRVIQRAERQPLFPSVTDKLCNFCNVVSKTYFREQNAAGQGGKTTGRSKHVHPGLLRWCREHPLGYLEPGWARMDNDRQRIAGCAQSTQKTDTNHPHELFPSAAQGVAGHTIYPECHEARGLPGAGWGRSGLGAPGALRGGRGAPSGGGAGSKRAPAAARGDAGIM